MAEDNKNSGSWKTRAALAGIIKASTSYVTTVYIIPFGISALSAYLGHIQGLPLMNIMVGTAVMFAAVMTGLVRFDEWRERRRVRDKFGFNAIRIVRDVNGPRLALGVNLVSTASFNLEFELVSCRTRLGDRVPKNEKFERRNFTVPPNGQAHFDDHLIDAVLNHGSSIDGFAEFKLQYGRVGSLKYTLVIRKQGIVALDQNGALIPTTWSDSADEPQ